MKKYFNLGVIVLFVTILLSGCSQKCMENEYNCTPGEKVLQSLIHGAADTAEFLNKYSSYKH